MPKPVQLQTLLTPELDPRDLAYFSAARAEIAAAADWWHETQEMLLDALKAQRKAEQNVEKAKMPAKARVLSDPQYKNGDSRNAAIEEALSRDDLYLMLLNTLETIQRDVKQYQTDIAEAEAIRRECRHSLDFATAWLNYASLQEVHE